MRHTKTLGFAGALVLSALVGGTLIGSTLAQDGETDAGTGAYCDTFMDAFASELGSTRDEIVVAGKAAAVAAIDAAVAAGDLTQERATTLKERIEAAAASECGWLGKAGFARGFGHGFGHGVARGMIGADVFEAAAEALGIEGSELIGQLHDAGSLEALATELGATYDEVTSSVLTAVQADLDAAVAEGMDQARADEILARITTWLDEGGQAGEFRFGGGRGHHGFGPWGDRDSDDEDAEDSGA